MNFSYDLIEQPWIPVLPKEGQIREMGLLDVLVSAHLCREIAHDSPLFTASIHALLTAILHRALSGTTRKERLEAWRRLWAQGHFDAEAIDAYIAKWHNRFDLFHPEYPFYQVKGLEMNEVSPISRFAMEEQNAPAMFSNRANPDWEAPSPALAAQLLVAIQSFALGFGKSSKARIEGQEIEPPYSADGPLLRGLTVWPSGRNVFETLMLGLVPHELAKNDKPCWEQDKPHELRDTIVAGKRKTVAPLGICDLLTLQSRLIRLIPIEKNEQLIVPGAYFTQGRSLEKDGAGRPSFHPLKMYLESEKLGVLPVSLSADKAIWRNAHTLFSKAARSYHEQNPVAWVAALKGDDAFEGWHSNLQVVGMATEPGKAGKFLLWRHERMPLAPSLLTDENLVARLKDATEDTQRVADEMRRRFAIVARTFIVGEKDSGRSPDLDDVSALIDKFDPRRAFWPRIEEHFYQLLEHLGKAPEKALSDWEANLSQTGKECLRAACEALGTSPKATVAVAQITLHDGYNLAYLRAPKAYTAQQKVLKAAEKARSASASLHNSSPSLASTS